MLEGKLMFVATPTRKDQTHAAIESFAVSPSVHDEESTSFNTTMNTTLNTTRMDTSLVQSPREPSPHRSQDSGTGMQIALFLDDLLPKHSAQSSLLSNAASSRLAHQGSDAYRLSATMPSTVSSRWYSERQYVQPPTFSPGRHRAQVSKTMSYAGEARTEFAKRVSETAKAAGLPRVVGLHVPLVTGLRVKPVDASTFPHRTP